MSKDQNPSDKACDAYFDNPYAATSGSYYSDRVTFYAGFAAGAASRDAEVVSLTNQRDYEYVRAENAEQERDQFEQERDQLREHVTMLRDALLTCSVGDFSTGHVIPPSFDEKLVEEALAATEQKP